MERKFYIYVYFRPDGSPCYVGKGQGIRWQRHELAQTNTHLWNIIQKAGGSLPKLIARDGLTDAEAYEIEAAWIAAIGREEDGGPLVNKALGGKGGGTGYRHTSEQRANRARVSKEWWDDPVHGPARRAARASMMAATSYNKGRPTSEKQKRVSAEKLRGNTRTLGMRHSDETRAKMRAKWADPVWRADVLEKRRNNPNWTVARVKKSAATKLAKSAAKLSSAS